MHSVSGDLFAFPFTAPLSFLGARGCGGDGVPIWVPKRAPGTSTARTARSYTPEWKGRQLFSQAAVGGSRGDSDRCGSPSPSRSGKAGSGVCSQAGNHPPPPNQIPRRGRAGAGSGGGSGRRQCNFTRPLGLGFSGRVMNYGALSLGETEVV